MASGSWTFGTSNQYIQGGVWWYSSSNGSSANSSTVRVEVWFRRTNTGYTSYGTINTGVQCDSGVYWENGLSVSIQNNWVLTNSHTYTVPHNNDGSKSCYIRATGNANFSLGSFDTSTYVTLDKIPRYATIKTFNVLDSNITQTSALLSWSTDVNVDEAQYSLNGSSWTRFAQPESTNGSLSLSDLKPGTTYSIKIRVKRTDSQLWTESNTKSFTTIPIASISNDSIDFNIGNDLVINFTNSDKNKSFLALQVETTDGTWEEVIRTDEVLPLNDETSYTWTLSNNAILLYSKVPTRNKANIRIICGTTINSTVYDNSESPKTGVMSVVNSNPTFSTYSYGDANTTTQSVLGNTSYMPEKYGDMQAHISTSNKATAKNQATITKYVAIVKNSDGKTVISKEATYSSTAQVDFKFGAITTSGTYTINIYAIDSRGNASSTIQKTFYVLPYHQPTATIELSRLNDYEQETVIKITAYYSKLKVGSTNKNTTFNVKYRYAEAGTTLSGDYTAVTGWSSSDYGDSDIKATMSQNPFVNLNDNSNNSYTFEFQITDKLSTVIDTKPIEQGIPLTFQGVNGQMSIGMLPDIDSSAKFQVASDIMATDSDGTKVNILSKLNNVNNTLSSEIENINKDINMINNNLSDKSINVITNSDVSQVYQIANIIFRSGTRVLSVGSSTRDWVKLFSLSELKSYFGDDIMSTRLSIFTYNGDSASVKSHFYEPEFYSDGYVYQYFYPGITGSIRINYLMIYVKPSM